MKTNLQISVRRMAAIGMMALGALAARATEEVIWWQVPEDPSVETFHEGFKSASDLGATEARIRASDGNYLDLFIDPQELQSIGVPMEVEWFALPPSDAASLSFMVELGNWENGQWVGIAHSQSYTYSELASHIVSDWSNPYATLGASPWIAEGYVVPEPSSGILLLIGGGLLALRRKRRG